MDGIIKRVTQKERQDVLDYLCKDDPLLNAYAINRLQNNVLGIVETYVATDNIDFKLNGYLSMFEGLGRAIDIWIRGNSLEVEQQLLDFFCSHFYPSQEKRKVFVSTDTRMSETIRTRFSNCKIDFQVAMLVRKGEERIPSSEHRVVTIHEELAEEWTRFVLPEGWELSKEIVENNRKFLKQYTAFGIMDSNGRIVSAADSFLQLAHVTAISGVETHPNYKRMGYGTAVVSAALQNALSRSRAAMLFVGVGNYDAIRIYERLGFRKIGECICAETL